MTQELPTRKNLGFSSDKLLASVEYAIGDFFLERPCVELTENDRSKRFIDIFATIKRNATSIGHPAILHAIKHWEHVVCFYYHLALRSEGKSWSNWFGMYQLAERNLKYASAALFEGAKERAIPKEAAFKIIIEVTGLEYEIKDMKSTYEIINSNLVKEKRRVDEKLRIVAQCLSDEARISFYKELEHTQEIHRRYNKRPLVEWEIDDMKQAFKSKVIRKVNFLYSDLKESESRYRPCLLEKPGTWDNFRLSFIASQFSISKSTVQTYLSRASNMNEFMDFQFPNRSLNCFITKDDFPPVVLVKSPFVFD